MAEKTGCVCNTNLTLGKILKTSFLASLTIIEKSTHSFIVIFFIFTYFNNRFLIITHFYFLKFSNIATMCHVSGPHIDCVCVFTDLLKTDTSSLRENVRIIDIIIGFFYLFSKMNDVSKVKQMMHNTSTLCPGPWSLPFTSDKKQTWYIGKGAKKLV